MLSGWDFGKLAQWRTRYWPWARGSLHWVSRIPAKKFLDPSGTIPSGAKRNEQGMASLAGCTLSPKKSENAGLS